MKNACIFVVILLAFFVWKNQWADAKRIGIAVDQTSIAFDADTEENHEFVVKITNVSDKKQNVVIGAIDYHVGDNNELSLKSEFDELEGVKDWITTNQENISLASGESQEVIFNFSAPASATVGSHRGAVIFRAKPDDVQNVSVQGQIAVHTLINIKGNTHASGKIESFDSTFFTWNKVKYVAVFGNTGNIHYIPYGELIVKNIITKSEHVHKFDKHFVFPDRKFTFEHSDKIPSIFGLYHVKVNFVDGERVVRTKGDLTMGVLFPITIIALIIVLRFVIVWILQKRKEKTDQRLDKAAKKRKTINLQKELEEYEGGQDENVS